MKQQMRLAFCLLLALTMLPAAAISERGQLQHLTEQAQIADEQEYDGQQQLSYDETTIIRVWDAQNETTLKLTLQQYLYGVVCAEMPATFEPEALKAQAVAARSYTLYQLEQGSCDHPDGSPVCTDSTHCKAYRPLSEAQAEWGENAEAYTKIICDAVDQTAGQVATYDGKPICAVFHSTSSGMTEAAADVWGGSVPYLQAVSSEGDAQSPYYESQATFSIQEVKDILSARTPAPALGDDPTTWFGEPARSASGGVLTIQVGDQLLSGREMRELFRLRSSNFSVECTTEGVVFTVHGYGHGVGMSQYGAQAMAQEGYDWQGILRWYYTGIRFEQRT